MEPGRTARASSGVGGLDCQACNSAELSGSRLGACRRVGLVVVL